MGGTNEGRFRKGFWSLVSCLEVGGELEVVSNE